MGLGKVLAGILGLLIALVAALVAGFAGMVNMLPLDVEERNLLVPPDLEALYRQVDYESGIDWAILAAWDGAEYGFHLPVPSVAHLYAEKVAEVIEQLEQEAEEYCEEHPEDEILCPPGPVTLDPEEQVQIWGWAYATWRSLLKQHVLAHATAMNPHLLAFWRDPEPVYRLFLSTAQAAVAAELFEGYLILDEVTVAEDDLLIEPISPPVAWEPVDGFTWPALGPITSRYGMRYSPIDGQLRLHAGIDLGLDSGTEIRATKGGQVVEAGNSPVYGRYVILQHDGHYRSLYAHNSALAVAVG